MTVKGVMLALAVPSCHAVLSPGPRSEVTEMSANMQSMTGGRMATVLPTHIRLDPNQSVSNTPQTTNEERDNAINFGVRYNPGASHNPRHAVSRTKSQSPAGKPDKRISSGTGAPRIALTPVFIESNPNGVGLCQENSRMVFSCPSQDLGSWTVTPLVFSCASPTNCAKSRKCSASSSTSSSLSSSSSSGDDASSPLTRSPLPLPASESGSVFDEQLPPVPPPRGTNSYQNVPAPGLVPLARSSPQQLVLPHASTDMISLYSSLSQYDNETDKQRKLTALQRLNASGFFYGTISAQEAKEKLRHAQVGTFLVRVSSQINSQSSQLFALSVKTNRGTTSIRLTYENGNFRLDADPHSASKMPAFDCIIALIEFYVAQSESDARNKCVFLESNGRRDTPVILTRPLRQTPQSLKHLCRRTLHYNFSQDNLSSLLKSSETCSIQTKEYIQKYPYSL